MFLVSNEKYGTVSIYLTQPVAFNIQDKSCTDVSIVEIKPYWIDNILMIASG